MKTHIRTHRWAIRVICRWHTCRQRISIHLWEISEVIFSPSVLSLSFFNITAVSFVYTKTCSPKSVVQDAFCKMLTLCSCFRIRHYMLWLPSFCLPQSCEESLVSRVTLVCVRSFVANLLNFYYYLCALASFGYLQGHLCSLDPLSAYKEGVTFTSSLRTSISGNAWSSW